MNWSDRANEYFNYLCEMSDSGINYSDENYATFFHYEGMVNMERADYLIDYGNLASVERNLRDAFHLFDKSISYHTFVILNKYCK